MGVGEASVALQSILIAAFGKSGVGALNVTDEVAYRDTFERMHGARGRWGTG